MPSRQSCWEIYNNEMSELNHGHALWEPAPLSSYKHVQPGDVGYIRTGCFHLLFSAGCPLGERQLGVHVPPTFKPLDVGPIVNRQPLPPGYLSTDNIQVRQSRLKLSTPSSSTSSPSTAPLPMLEPGSIISFRLEGGQGAALVTKYEIFREDIERAGSFEKYAKKHYASWVDFARKAGHGDDIIPVLVTGVDRTRDFAMMSYSNGGNNMASEFTISVPQVTSTSAWGIWRTTGVVFTNRGPRLPLPPCSAQTAHLTLPGDDITRPGSDWCDQCVFVRYYTIRRRLGIPKVIKAGAGPHDPGAGSSEDRESPKVEARSPPDSGSDVAPSFYDSDEKNSVTSVESEPNTVIHNTAPDGEDDFDVIADYVFRNSDADFALIHHRDITTLRRLGGGTGLSTQLLEWRPPITVDENGVGTIGGHANPSVSTTHDLDPEGNFVSAASGPLVNPGTQLGSFRDPQPQQSLKQSHGPIFIHSHLSHHLPSLQENEAGEKGGNMDSSSSQPDPLFTHLGGFWTLIQSSLFRKRKRNLSAIHELPTSGWDRRSMRKCWEFLDMTSRNFSAVIKELDGELARVICIFYLVLRGLETVEGDLTIPDEIKQPTLRSFYKYSVTPGWTFNGSGRNEKDRQLLVEYDVVIEELNRLQPEYRDIIVEICQKMGTGMADFAHKAATTGEIYLKKIEDWDLYCHYAAGLAGEGHSRLLAASGKEQPWLADQLELSNSMGLFLQKTIIIRDYREDVEQRQFLWPMEIWTRDEYSVNGHGAFKEMEDMCAPENEEQALWVLSGLIVDVLRHAPDCLDYLRLLKNQTVFNFCAIPQVMAIATLSVVFMNAQTFQGGVKIRQTEAAGLVTKATNPRNVAYLFRDYARRIHVKCDPKDPNFLKIAISCGHIEMWCEVNYPSFVSAPSRPNQGPVIDPNDRRSTVVALGEKHDKELKLQGLAKDTGRRVKDILEPRAKTTKETYWDSILFMVVPIVAVLGLGLGVLWFAISKSAPDPRGRQMPRSLPLHPPSAS